MLVHPDHIEQVAASAYAIFKQKFPGRPESPAPDWGGLPPGTKTRWRDLVNDFNREPRLLEIESPNHQEAAMTVAIRAYQPPPEYNPDAAIAKLQGGQSDKRK